MKTINSYSKSPQSADTANPIVAIKEALRIGNFSLVRKLCKDLLRNPEQASMRPQALDALARISIDPAVLWIGGGVFVFISLLSLFFMFT